MNFVTVHFLCASRRWCSAWKPQTARRHGSLNFVQFGILVIKTQTQNRYHRRYIFCLKIYQSIINKYPILFKQGVILAYCKYHTLTKHACAKTSPNQTVSKSDRGFLFKSKANKPKTSAPLKGSISDETL